MDAIISFVMFLGFILALLAAVKIFEKAAEWIEGWFEEKK